MTVMVMVVGFFVIHQVWYQLLPRGIVFSVFR
jgi:hypothetical protein